LIRVLDILPKYTLPNKYVRTRIRHVRLDDDSEYDAISYTWGDSTKMRGILVDDKWPPVTENAFAVIEDRVSRFESKTIWIDCICINQNDDQEKAEQVKMMSRIYQRANRTILWLGDIPDAIRAFSLVTDIAGRVTRRGPNEPSGYTLGTHDTIRIWLCEQYNKRDGRFESLARLLGHPYFCRVWIMQEIIFSKAVHMRCGTCWLNWSTFEWAILLLGDSRFRRLVGHYYLMQHFEDVAVLEQIKTISSFRSDLNDSAVTSRPPLSDLLSGGSIAVASDERDYIYGVLSMSTEVDDPELTPDYTIDSTKLFKRTAAVLLRKSELTEVLYCAGVGYRRKLENLPSWIPDWTSRPAANRLRKRNIATFDASAGRNHPIRACESDSIAIHGIKFDRVAAISSRPFPGENFKLTDPKLTAAALDVIFTEIETQGIVDGLPDTYGLTGQSRQEAFWRTKILDRTRKLHVPGRSVFANSTAQAEIEDTTMYERPAPLERWKVALEQVQFVFFWVKSAGLTRNAFFESKGEYNSAQALPLLQKFIEGLSSSEASFIIHWIQNVQEYFEAMCFSCSGRKFAITEKGCMALVPPFSQVGDEVCVLSNMDVPLILRQVPDSSSRKYQLVGKSYVHGIMDGQAYIETAIEEEFLIR
jgi:Heterokaryon incompatibility protein (HET)